MIAVFSQNEVSSTSSENPEYLEKQVATIASAEGSPTSQGIHSGLDDIVAKAAKAFEIAARATIEQAFVMGRALSQLKQDLKGKEYQIFLDQPGWTTTKANKYVNYRADERTRLVTNHQPIPKEHGCHDWRIDCRLLSRRLRHAQFPVGERVCELHAFTLKFLPAERSI